MNNVEKLIEQQVQKRNRTLAKAIHQQMKKGEKSEIINTYKTLRKDFPQKFAKERDQLIAYITDKHQRNDYCQTTNFVLAGVK